MLKIFIFSFFIFLVLAPVAFAAVGDTAPTAKDCNPKRDICNPMTNNDFESLVKSVVAFLYKLGLYAVAPLMIVIGGFQIMTAGANSENVTKGKNAIMWAVIGIIVLILASGLVSLVKDILEVQK